MSCNVSPTRGGSGVRAFEVEEGCTPPPGTGDSPPPPPTQPASRPTHSVATTQLRDHRLRTKLLSCIWPLPWIAGGSKLDTRLQSIRPGRPSVFNGRPWSHLLTCELRQGKKGERSHERLPPARYSMSW